MPVGTDVPDRDCVKCEPLPTSGDAGMSIEQTSRVTVTTLTAHRFLHGLPRGQVAKLAPAACLIGLPPGCRIFEDGGSAANFWLIRSGSVALDLHTPRAGAVVVETLGMGDALGWSWLLPPYVWTLGATTVRPTEAFQFDGRAVRALCDADPELGFQLTRRFLSVAADRLLATRGRLLDHYVPARPWP
jgi:CRP/FNR family cyclic AMP-dependent transcriptional regulator